MPWTHETVKNAIECLDLSQYTDEDIVQPPPEIIRNNPILYGRYLDGLRTYPHNHPQRLPVDFEEKVIF